MIQLHKAVENYLEQFREFETTLNGKKTSPVHIVRRKAIERFKSLGFPTPRHEEWRYTNLNPITGSPFLQASIDSPPESVFSGLPFASVLANETLCVFVNGHFNAARSTVQNIPDGVVVTNLETALQRHPQRVLSHLDTLQEGTRNAFAELNTAFLKDGAFIFVPKNTVVPQPINIIFQSVPGTDPIVTHPRVLVIAEPGSQTSIVETYVGHDGTVYFNNALTEIFLGENAIVEHYRIQNDASGALHMANLHVHQQRASRFQNHTFLYGASLHRNNIAVVLDGEGAESTLNGLYLVRGSQHMDTHSVIDHAKPHCNSRERYKGIIADQGRGVFSGKIIVRKDAQKTDARQSNNNLLLSETASIDTKPQLEILADDVKCTHGATVGRLDDSALFYLRSRGIGMAEARDMLIRAFAGDIVSQVGIPRLQEYLDEHIRTLLHANADAQGIAS